MSRAARSGARQRLVLVTGPSGAGRSTAINVFEDLGFEAIDNLPLGLLERLFSGPASDRPMVLGLDVRNRDFSQLALLAALDGLQANPSLAPELLYLDCALPELQRRFSATRRRHPLAPGETAVDGIRREQDLLEPIRERADILIDTSDLSPHMLRRQIERWFAPQGGQRLGLTVQSFSYKRGLPLGADMVIDCRFLRNPYWQADLRRLDGCDPAVAAHIAGDSRFAPFFERTRDLVLMLLPAYLEEGRSHFSLGFGCTGGQHRSVFAAERLAEALAQAGWQVSIRHRELDRQARLGRQSASEARDKD
ncbi:RNase adapter RapZ [Shimia sp.]|uniref:RNase adapter RapZ n=1 Tax=Shimia sp. TaxID=1954381 RepID=UPI0035653CC8